MRPDWDMRLLPKVGHVPQMEAPERWLAAVEDWLRRACRARRFETAPAAFESSASDSSSAKASRSTSGMPSQSPVSPNAIVPPSDVHAIDSAEFSPSGIDG